VCSRGTCFRVLPRHGMPPTGPPVDELFFPSRLGSQVSSLSFFPQILALGCAKEDPAVFAPSSHRTGFPADSFPIAVLRSLFRLVSYVLLSKVSAPLSSFQTSEGCPSFSCHLFSRQPVMPSLPDFPCGQGPPLRERYFFCFGVFL